MTDSDRCSQLPAVASDTADARYLGASVHRTETVNPRAMHRSV